jgi:triose/dihydroxyacetone kinase / FAD-AMP lyase (cyclizing)
VGQVVPSSRVFLPRPLVKNTDFKSIFFSSLAQGLQVHSPSLNAVATSALWSLALHTALNNLYTYTRARPPSRTLIDPLSAFVHEGLAAAFDAAERTRDLEPTVGRSAYVDKARLRGEQLPDPGAWGVKVVLEALFEKEPNV